MWIHAEKIILTSDPVSALASFAIGDIKAALIARGHSISQAEDASIEITLTTLNEDNRSSQLKPIDSLLPKSLKTEGFVIRKTSTNEGTSIWVVGADEAGMMYGGLELAEVISVSGLNGIHNEGFLKKPELLSYERIQVFS